MGEMSIDKKGIIMKKKAIPKIFQSLLEKIRTERIREIMQCLCEGDYITDQAKELLMKDIIELENKNEKTNIKLCFKNSRK